MNWDEGMDSCLRRNDGTGQEWRPRPSPSRMRGSIFCFYFGLKSSEAEFMQ